MSEDSRELWQRSFEEQIARHAYNTSPVEAVVRNVAYYLRSRFERVAWPGLHFLEVGCGAGPNLAWLAEKGIRVSGVDIAPNALELARANLGRLGFAPLIGELREASAIALPFADASFDGIIEACVFQHFDPEERRHAFTEVARVLKPGGLFAGYLLSDAHSIYREKKASELPEDPGTLMLEEGGSNIYLSNIGRAHFYRREEFRDLLPGFAVIDPCAVDYDIPREEAERRGYQSYRQGMWALHAIK
jgi:SAM-dependent methyltransferase